MAAPSDEEPAGPMAERSEFYSVDCLVVYSVASMASMLDSKRAELMAERSVGHLAALMVDLSVVWLAAVKAYH